MSAGQAGNGLSTAVAAVQAVAGEQSPGADAEQLALPVLPLAESVPATSPGADQGAPNNDASPRGPGRPPGSKNKRTEEWVEYLLSRYRSPLVVLAEVYSRSVDDLAKELRCDRLEAFDRMLAAAKTLAPYLHQAQPQAVRIDGKGMLQLVINPYGGQDPGAEQAENGTITIIDQKPEKSEG